MRAKPQPCAYVYLVATARGRPVKVGFTIDPKGRLSGIRNGSHEKLEMVHKWRVARGDARPLEKAMHKLFAFCRQRGEWFDIAWLDLKAVGDVLIGGDPVRAQALADILEDCAERAADYGRLLTRSDNTAMDMADDLMRREAARRVEGLRLGLIPNELERWRIRAGKPGYRDLSHPRAA